MHLFLTVTFTTCILLSSIAQAAEPVMKQPRRPSIPQQQGNVQQLKITPEYLNQQISMLKQQVNGLQAQNRQIMPLKKQVNALQAQVNILRSVVQITQNGTTIQAEHLALNAGKTLTMSSGKETGLTAGDNLSLTSAKNLSLQGGKDITAEGDGKITLKAPQIKLNDGTKPLGIVGSHVSGGKVVTGSTSVFAK